MLLQCIHLQAMSTQSVFLRFLHLWRLILQARASTSIGTGPLTFLSLLSALLVDIRLDLLVILQRITVAGNQKIEFFWHQLSQAEGLGLFSNLTSRHFESGDVALPLVNRHNYLRTLLDTVRPADGVRQCLDPLPSEYLAIMIELPPTSHFI